MVTAGVIIGTNGDQLRDSTEIFTDNVWKTITGKLPSPTNACRAININNRILLFGEENIKRFKCFNVLTF